MISMKNMKNQDYKTPKKNRIKLTPKYKVVIDYVMMVVAVLFVFVPLYIAIITSLMSEQEANFAQFHWWPEHGFTFAAYKDVLFKKMAGTSILAGIKNTLWIYLPGIFVGLFTSALAAYAFAKIKFRLSGPMFAVLLGVMTVPNCMGTIASYLLYDTIGWVNTPFPLMVPLMFGSISIVFFMRQFYMGIPDDLMGAAKIDGAGNLGIFVNILLPISIPALSAQFILQFIGCWNDYMAPLLYLTDASMYTLQIALAFFQGVYTQNWPLRMAGAMVAMMPLIIMYFISQRFVLRGLEMSVSLKG